MQTLAELLREVQEKIQKQEEGLNLLRFMGNLHNWPAHTKHVVQVAEKELEEFKNFQQQLNRFSKFINKEL
jgi:hypothetical protein